MASFFAQCCSSNLQPLLAPEWLSMQTCCAFPRPLLESSSETNLAEAHGQHRPSTLDSRRLKFPAGLGDLSFFIFFPSNTFHQQNPRLYFDRPKGWQLWILKLVGCVSQQGRGNNPWEFMFHSFFSCCMLEDVGRRFINPYQPQFLRQLPAQMLLSEDPWSFPTVDCKGRRQHLLLQFHLVCRKNGLKRDGARYECKQCYPKYVKMRDQRHAARDKFFMSICLGILYGHIYICVYMQILILK